MAKKDKDEEKRIAHIQGILGERLTHAIEQALLFYTQIGVVSDDRSRLLRYERAYAYYLKNPKGEKR